MDNNKKIGFSAEDIEAMVECREMQIAELEALSYSVNEGELVMLGDE